MMWRRWLAGLCGCYSRVINGAFFDATRREVSYLCVQFAIISNGLSSLAASPADVRRRARSRRYRCHWMWIEISQQKRFIWGDWHLRNIFVTLSCRLKTPKLPPNVFPLRFHVDKSNSIFQSPQWHKPLLYTTNFDWKQYSAAAPKGMPDMLQT